MELVHSAVLATASLGIQSSRRLGILPQVRIQSPVSQNLIIPHAMPSTKVLGPDFFLDEEEEWEEDDKKHQKQDTTELDWAVRARELAIHEMQSRNFTDRDFEALLPPHLRLTTQEKKKKKEERKLRRDRQQEQMLPIARSLNVTPKPKKKKEELNNNMEAAEIDPNKLKALAKRFNARRKRFMGIQRTEMDSETEQPEVEAELSIVYSGDRRAQSDDDSFWDTDSDSEEVLPLGKDTRMRKIHLNQDLVDSRNVEDVLDALARVEDKFQLSPINVSTALHRLAKHMVSVGMSEPKRLKYARQSDVCELVASAMELLPECSAQGVSNIAWALSKIGGNLLYRSEMEIVSRVALAKVDEMNSQNVANLAGAFASMQHSSSLLFDKLASKASLLIEEFAGQELAQLLWSYACMGHQPGIQLLDSLDRLVNEGSSTEACVDDDKAYRDTKDFSFEQLTAIAWSYVVLGQLERPFFMKICTDLRAFDQDPKIGPHKYMLQLTQLHQVLLAVKFEGKHLGIDIGERLERLAAAAWEKERISSKATSFLQKDMERFLVCTGRKWVSEYVDADYSLDFALADNKVAIEVNGPSHFARNTGELLGHTVLKHRLLSAAGWKVISASYAEWENLQGESEHVEYIQRLVAPHLNC